jgi:hypothetical protein
MTIILSRDEKDLLDNIMNDKFQAGAFCGMIFNKVEEVVMAHPSLIFHETVAQLIQEALQVRLIAHNMSK